MNHLPTTRSCLVPAAIILAAGAARPAFAQPVIFQELYTFNGDNALDYFGRSVSGAGDVNGDGFDDLIVGAWGDDNNADRAGSARVFSGANGSVLFTFNGDSADDNFGYSVSGAGDVNGDGFDDLIVGARGDDNNGDRSGSARVFSGADGSVLFTFNGDSAGDLFGWSVSGAGDVNGDGFDDLIVGAYGDDNNGNFSGSARVFSGVDGSVLFTVSGDGALDFFGRSVSGAGDVNGDGFDDLIIGALGDDNNGSYSGNARVFSGADGSVLFNFNGDSAGDRFGWSVSGAGDVNGDGFADLIVGAYRDDNNGSYSGSACVFSGANGSVLFTFNGDSAGDRFGWSVSGAGDVNSDGFDDLIVGARGDDNNGPDSGSARVFSGANGSLLVTVSGESANDYFGFSVSGAGDVNGDGFDDLIVGANGDDNNGSYSGSARVIISKVTPVLYTFNGDNAFAEFGNSVSGAGDVNGDGFADLIVGAYRDDNNGPNSGSARVFSGANGSVLYTFNGDSGGDQLGWSVSGAGDVNGDGFDDLIAGAPGDDNNGLVSGSARVFSGANGSVLFTFNGDGVGDFFGRSVSGAGDVNGDGFDDFIVGADRDDNNGSYSGSARVFSGANGSVLFTFNGDSANDHFGASVSGAGDVNGDGFDDLIVGARQPFNPPLPWGRGFARVLSGANGSVLYTFNGIGTGDEFGASVSGAGDVNGDGFADLIVGAPGTSLTGIARVFSGVDGSVLFTFNGDFLSDFFGDSVSGAGDVNGDGFDDLIVGAHNGGSKGTGSFIGIARVFSGIDGSVLATFIGDSEYDQFGYSVSGAGDVNGDGFDDFIVGAPRDDNNGDRSGSARVFISVVTTPTTPDRLCADQNEDGVVTSADFSAWIANFNAQSLIADVNQDGFVTAADFTAWIAAFNQGVNGPTCVP